MYLILCLFSIFFSNYIFSDVKKSDVKKVDISTDGFPQPVIIKGSKIRKALGFRVSQYGVFVAGKNHYAEPIPFQIDEVNKIGDYVLPKSNGLPPMFDNGIFDDNDELVVRGTDLRKRDPLIRWKNKPSFFFEIIIRNSTSKEELALYLSVDREKSPPKHPARLLSYDHKKGIIETSKYRFKFNPKNHMVMDYIYIKDENNKEKWQRVIDRSQFIFYADIKYFFEIELTSNDLITKLNYWKIGPVRIIAQVSFFFRLLSMDIDIEMYTEISMFENAISLPAVLNSPIDAKKLFRKGSGFYYGLKFTNGLKEWKFNTNFKKLSSLKSQESVGDISDIVKEGYWIQGKRDNWEFFMEFKPSVNLLVNKAVPFLHLGGKPREWLKRHDTNIGIFMDTSGLKEGDYTIAVVMYFDNRLIQKISPLLVNKVRLDINPKLR